jgi:hypothetical protein
VPPAPGEGEPQHFGDNSPLADTRTHHESKRAPTFIDRAKSFHLLFIMGGYSAEKCSKDYRILL